MSSLITDCHSNYTNAVGQKLWCQSLEVGPIDTLRSKANMLEISPLIFQQTSRHQLRWSGPRMSHKNHRWVWPCLGSEISRYPVDLPFLRHHLSNDQVNTCAGLFIALALRFDYHLSTLQANKEDNKLKIAIPTPTSGAYPKTYYYSTLIAYLTGLITTIIVMHKFQHAQPALLYLSPACCLSVILVATWKRQLRHLFAYAEEPNEANGHAQGKAANAENLSADASSMLSAGKLAAEKAATKRHTPTTQAGERTGESDGALADDEGANLGKDREEKCKNG